MDNETYPFATPTATQIDQKMKLFSFVKGKPGHQSTLGAYERFRHLLMVMGRDVKTNACSRKAPGLGREEGFGFAEKRKFDLSSRKELIVEMFSDRTLVTEENSALWRSLFLNPEWAEWLMGWPLGLTDTDGFLGTVDFDDWAERIQSGQWWSAEPVPRILVSSGDKEWEEKNLARHKQIGNGQVSLCIIAVWRMMERANVIMADTVCRDIRSRIMSAIRSTGTTPEEAVADVFASAGVECERNAPDLPGRPDFVLPGKVAVFVDGCFWHGCPDHYVEPKSNVKFWRSKIEKNRSRDRSVDALLNAMGYRVVRIYEHDLKGPAEKVRERVLGIIPPGSYQPFSSFDKNMKVRFI